MKNLFFQLVFIFSGFLVNAQNNYNVEKLDSLFNILNSNKKIMGSISVFSNGEEIYQRSLGYADLENKSEANALTKYRIGSITKTFTAVVVVQLIEEGKLNINTPLDKFFPEVPNSKNITIEHLLRHQSGLYNVTDEENFRTWMVEPQSRKEMLNRINKKPVIFGPGERSEYSNTNYLFLSYIAEEIESKEYAEILKERIIDKLNLQNTFYGGKIDPKDNQALSYVKSERNWDLLPETDMSVPMGAGAIVSTPEDLNIFFCKLFEGGLVSENSLKAMKTTTNGTGIGLMKPPIPEIVAFGHGGGIDGFSSLAVHLPKEKITIAYLANASDYPMNNVLMGVMKIVLDHEYELPDF